MLGFIVLLSYAYMIDQFAFIENYMIIFLF